MNNSPQCPKCSSTYAYSDGVLWTCPECAHEWPLQEAPVNEVYEANFVVKDSGGQVLKDGDGVVVIKDLKVKGASKPVKIGTKVKNIHLVESTDGHNISCKIDGFGAMHLKSEFVRKM